MSVSTQLWVGAPHFFRLCFDLDRTAQLLRRLPQSVGVICDVSHIVASGSTPPEFVALELETRDISNDERPAAALAAGVYLSPLL